MGFISALKKKGYSPEKLKSLFENPELESTTNGSLGKVRKLIERHRGLIRDGLTSNYQSVRHWRAIDDAYDAGQEQVTTTIMRGLISKSPDSSEVLSAIKYWKLDKLIVTNPETGARELSLPTFFNIFVPLVAAYTKVRWAKLWTDRDTVPLYKYSPAAPTLNNYMVSRVITNEIAHDAEGMNYRAIERETILATLLYSYSWTFPKSDYLIQKSIWEENGKVEEYVVREGIDWIVVHPSKCFFDRSHPLNTINTDSGISWMGHWSVTTYSAIKGNKKYWNTESVAMYAGDTTTTWITPSFSSLYFHLYPCTLDLPPVWSDTNTNTRERVLYDHSTENKAVQIVTFFDKIIPSEWGLYDCDIPVWHQFIYAGDGTVIHCVPMAYTPGAVSLYDFDTNRARNTSLALELVPTQDHISNLLTQYLLSVKQNLANLNFIDERQVPPETIKKIENLGQHDYVGMNILPYNRLEHDNMGATAGEAVTPLQFTRHPLSEITSSINTVISVMERMLGYSPQEVGAAASHEQSATEVAVTSAGTSTRLALTGSFIDEGRTARQRRAYDAWFEYSERKINQTLSGIRPAHKNALKHLGFTVKEVPDSDLIQIEGDRYLADMDSFIQARPPADRYPDSKVAIAMIQAIQMMLSSPDFIQLIGPEFLLKRFNQILEFAGVPGEWDFEIDNAKGGQPKLEEIAKALQDFTVQAIQANNKKLESQTQDVVNSVGQRFEQTDQALQSLTQDTGGHLAQQQKQLQELFNLVGSLLNPQPVPPPTAVIPALPPEPPPVAPVLTEMPVEQVAVM